MILIILASIITIAVMSIAFFEVLVPANVIYGLLCIAIVLIVVHIAAAWVPMLQLPKTNRQLPQKEKTLEDEIENIIKNRKHVFCPVIKSMCRTDCAAFETPVVKVVREAPPAHKYISGGVCTHAGLKHNTEDRQ